VEEIDSSGSGYESVAEGALLNMAKIFWDTKWQRISSLAEQ
jgi:hypothetical protein